MKERKLDGSECCGGFFLVQILDSADGDENEQKRLRKWITGIGEDKLFEGGGTTTHHHF